MPVAFSQEIAEQVCEHLVDGKSLRQIEKMQGMPSKGGILKWLLEGERLAAAGDTAHPKAQFVDQYARACQLRADRLFEECLDIADDSEADSFLGDDGKTVYNLEHIQRMRLRVDTRKWMVGKMNPKKYGEKVQNEVSGANGGPMTMQVRFMRADEKKGEE